uniref:RHS repeat-associated core domain-containing protein n=1 Tax=uncultured Akkermansia sp. TaxID=512294 RepID=UPI0026182AB9
GLIYYNYRHLNPHDGRWINRDPIMEQGGWNLFAFVNNNSIINFDLLGLLSFMSCVRFPDLSMICLISILEGLCVCPECKKIADKMHKAKSLDTLLEKGNELVKCAKNQKNDVPVTLEIIGPIFTNFGENAGGGPIPADKPYRILPKKDGGPKNKDGSYHKGTPSPTDLNKGTPGIIYDSRLNRNRKAIRIHELGLSRGCITIGSRYIDSEGKEIPLVSKNTGEGYIEQLMNAHNECGGFYLEIKEVEDEYKPEELINVKNSYDGAVYTPNTAATILKIPIM